jgi:ribulose-5-phosphate 4-epimerase/fuculose-1-phosphate aldolase
MAGKKTSVEQTRDEEKNAQVGNMLDAAFGDVGGLQVAPEEVHEPAEEEVEEPAEQSVEEPVEDEIESDDPVVDDATPPSEPPSGPPSKPPTGPPSGPPSKPPTGPPSGPPSKPPTGPPSGPPSKPPTGPPSGPPSKPPTGPPSEPPSDDKDPSPSEPMSDDAPKDEENDVVEGEASEESKKPEGEPEEAPVEEEKVDEVTEPLPDDQSPDLKEERVEDSAEDTPAEQAVELEQPGQDPVPPQSEPVISERTTAAEAEVARLSAEVARLRQSMAGAAEVIEDLETPPMPPAVLKDIVIGAHIVSDFARLARQLDREQLIRATMGTIAMLHPDQPSVMIATRNMTMLPRLDERGLCAAPLGGEAPPFAPEDWRLLEVVLASASLATGGPAAVIHSHGAYTTAASCEKDLVVVAPIDEIGKRNIGKVVIVDPDDDSPEDFLRQVMEALQQGGMRCVVVRGRGAYAVGRDLDQAWANAAMLEHSMRIVLLARQANLKI